MGIEQQIELNDTQKKIIKLLLEDNQLSAIKLADRIGIASRNIERNIKKAWYSYTTWIAKKWLL